MHTPAVTRDRQTGVFDGVTPYHWLVVIIASCGWLFDCMDQRLFILGRESALKELLRQRPGGAAPHQDAHRLRDHVDDPRLGDRRHHLRDDERQARPRENDGRDADRLLGLHRPVRPRDSRGSTSRSIDFSPASASAACSAPRRRWSPRACPAAFRAMALGSLQALSALGNIIGSLLSLKIPPGAQSFFGGYAGWRVLFFVGILPALLVVPIMFVLREPESWQKAKADAAAGVGREERRIAARAVPPSALAAEHARRAVPRRVGHGRAVGHRLLLARADLDRAEGRAAGRRSITVRGWGTAFQDVGSFLGHDRRSRWSPRSSAAALAFLGALLLSMVVTMFVFQSLQHGAATRTGCCR